MISKSFRKGFVDGFASPLNLFIAKPITRPAAFDGSVKRAWEGVGLVLSGAIRHQGNVNGQTAGTRKKRRRSAA